MGETVIGQVVMTCPGLNRLRWVKAPHVTLTRRGHASVSSLQAEKKTQLVHASGDLKASYLLKGSLQTFRETMQ